MLMLFVDAQVTGSFLRVSPILKLHLRNGNYYNDFTFVIYLI